VVGATDREAAPQRGAEEAAPSERELLEIVRAHVLSFDPARVRETMAPYRENAILVEEPDFKPDPRSYRGRKSLRGYWETWIKMWQATERRPLTFKARGNRVAVTFEYWAKARRSGAEARGQLGMVFTFDGREVTRHQLFGGGESALAALDD
jgi:hypothetical protein